MGLARRIALDVARGLAFLHGRKVCSFPGSFPNFSNPNFCFSLLLEKGIPWCCVGDWQADQVDEWTSTCIKVH